MTEETTTHEFAETTNRGADPLGDDDVLRTFGNDELPPLTVSIATMWTSVLASAESAMGDPITTNVALSLRANFPFLSFNELPAYWQRYHELVLDARTVLAETIAEFKPDHGDFIGEDDATENLELYLRITAAWQSFFRALDASWDTLDPSAGVELAAIQGANAFFLGPQGLLTYLNTPQIGFEWTEELYMQVEDYMNELTVEVTEGGDE